MTSGCGRSCPLLVAVVLAATTMIAPRGESTEPALPLGLSLEKLAWLTGAWRTSGSPEIEEYWSAPKAGLMIGMGRTIVRGKTVETESLRIEETKAGIDYVARPGGAGETRFKLVRATEREAAFENLAHDFPKRVLYRLEAGGLWARIEGDGSEKEKPLDFHYERLDWPAH